MGLFSWLRRGTVGLDVAELARRLGMPNSDLRWVRPEYDEFTIPKRSGRPRRIFAPRPLLKDAQRRIHRRLLARLRSHPCATGFERGHSIATNALHHAGQAVVVRMDIKNFFDSTRAKRIGRYFRKIGWNKEASRLLTNLCTHKGGLPQGAPSSPRLSNLVNYGLDMRLARLADKGGARYSRYADDLTFSFPEDTPELVHKVVGMAKLIVADYGYKLHRRRKLHIRRRHQQQLVTGLVINERVNLPRRTRRWLRSVEHRIETGGSATLTRTQLAGWNALRSMIETQTKQE